MADIGFVIDLNLTKKKAFHSISSLTYRTGSFFPSISSLLLFSLQRKKVSNYGECEYGGGRARMNIVHNSKQNSIAHCIQLQNISTHTVQCSKRMATNSNYFNL